MDKVGTSTAFALSFPQTKFETPETNHCALFPPELGAGGDLLIPLQPCAVLPPLPPEEKNRAQIPASCIASANGPSSAAPPVRRYRRDFPLVHLLIKLLICFGKSCVCEGLGKTLLGDASISPLHQRDEVCAPIDVCSGNTRA